MSKHVKFSCRSKSGFVGSRAFVPVQKSGLGEVLGSVACVCMLGALVWIMLAA